MPNSSNKLLASLSTNDFDLLEPHLESVTLGIRKSLEKPNRRIDAVYFPESGFASVVAVQRGKEVEVGLIGREGMTGLPIVLGNHRSPHATYVQAAGKGKCIPSKELRDATRSSLSLRDALLKYVQAFGVQTTHTAISNAQSRIDVRLARWLLMAHENRRRHLATHSRVFIAYARRPPTRCHRRVKRASEAGFDCIPARGNHGKRPQGHRTHGRRSLRHSRS
jgi:CRP-like cAMP-binding protein